MTDDADPMVIAYRSWKALREDRDSLLLGQQAADAEIERLRNRLADYQSGNEQLMEEVDKYTQLRFALGRITGIMHSPDEGPEWPGTDFEMIAELRRRVVR